MKLQFENLSKEARERLLHLADYLDKLPRRYWDKFDMGTWLEVIGKKSGPINGRLKGDGCDLGTLTDRDLMSCGTSACALGWAASLPKLQRAGLTHNLEIGDIDEKDRPTYAEASSFCVDGKPMEPLSAAQLFFDLSHNQAHYLFGGGLDGTPRPPT